MNIRFYKNTKLKRINRKLQKHNASKYTIFDCNIVIESIDIYIYTYIEHNKMKQQKHYFYYSEVDWKKKIVFSILLGVVFFLFVALCASWICLSREVYGVPIDVYIVILGGLGKIYHMKFQIYYFS